MASCEIGSSNPSTRPPNDDDEQRSSMGQQRAAVKPKKSVFLGVSLSESDKVGALLFAE
jgi:hypothetical protein